MSDNVEKKNNSEATRTCFKCGKSPAANNIKLFRFPQPGSRNMWRCEMWAKWCHPDKEWYSTEFQRKLHKEHLMLCNKHFHKNSFMDFDETKIYRHAVPQAEGDENGPVPLTIPACEASQPRPPTGTPVPLTIPACEASHPRPPTEPTSQDPVTKKPYNDHTYSKQQQEHIEHPHEDTSDTGQPYSPLSSRAATPAPPSVCRCCLAEGCDKDMTSPYQWDGVEEVYGDMLIDTFALELVADEPSAALLICDGCIEQLRRASQFKQRTISSATMFQQHVDELNASRADIPQPATTKRKIDMEVFPRDGNTNTFDSDSDFPESVTTEQFDWQIPMEAEYEINRARTAKSIHAQTTQEETIGMCDECGEVFEGVQVATQLIQHKKVEHAPPKKKKKIKAKRSYRYDNLLTIVSNSNACPFHWPTEENKRYRCYCCDLHYVELKELRRHFSSNHNMSEFCAEMRKKTSINQPIKLDIADLKCTNCEELCDDLEILRLHLSHMHNIESAVPEKTVALKIESEGYKCLECQHEFEGWQPLIRHMRVNGCVPMSSNTFECEDCGKRFFNKKTLRVHINKMHLFIEVKSRSQVYRTSALRANTLTLLEHSNMTIFIFDDVRFRCFSCHETFVHFHELMAHSDTHEASSAEAVDSVIKHPRRMSADITDLKCNVCQNAFEQIDEFQKHLVESHQVKFLKDGKHYLMLYMVRDGLKCACCKQSFLTSRTLVKHVNSRAGSKICEHCGKSYLSARTLRWQKIRAHGEINCAWCNITFLNHMARQMHTKSHHYGNGGRLTHCVFCKAEFGSRELKFRHLKEEHGYQSPEYKCAVCNKVFCTDRGYKMHKRCHRMKKGSATFHRSLGPKSKVSAT